MEEFRRVLRAKIHRATVTQANVDYEGSVTIPPELLEAAGIAPYEAVQIWDVTSGTRLETYAIEGVPGSRDICVNGAAAHLVRPGDLVIIACFSYFKGADLGNYEPRVVFVDGQNRMTTKRKEIAGPQRVPQLV